MNVYDELERAQNEKEGYLSNLEELNRQRQQELASNTKYDALISQKNQEIERCNEKIDSHCQMLSAYSFFNVEEIGNIITSLIRTFEGVNYSFQNTICEKKEERSNLFGTETITIKPRIRIIVLEKDKSEKYVDTDVHALINNGKAIVLSTTETFDNQIPFYKPNQESHSLQECVEFGKFAYVKNFIDELILYKIEKNSKYISYGELESKKIDFIARHQKEIERNYQKVAIQREKEVLEQLRKENEARQANLEILLKKNNN